MPVRPDLPVRFVEETLMQTVETLRDSDRGDKRISAPDVRVAVEAEEDPVAAEALSQANVRMRSIDEGGQLTHADFSPQVLFGFKKLVRGLPTEDNKRRVTEERVAETGDALLRAGFDLAKHRIEQRLENEPDPLRPWVFVALDKAGENIIEAANGKSAAGIKAFNAWLDAHREEQGWTTESHLTEQLYDRMNNRDLIIRKRKRVTPERVKKTIEDVKARIDTDVYGLENDTFRVISGVSHLFRQAAAFAEELKGRGEATGIFNREAFDVGKKYAKVVALFGPDNVTNRGGSPDINENAALVSGLTLRPIDDFEREVVDKAPADKKDGLRDLDEALWEMCQYDGSQSDTELNIYATAIEHEGEVIAYHAFFGEARDEKGMRYGHIADANGEFFFQGHMGALETA